jgi:hypothetical protein
MFRCAVRSLALALAFGLAACGGGQVAPTTLLDMRSLPDDSQRRSELLDSTQTRPGPENGKSVTPKERQVETVAASAAAVLGMFFSHSPNVLLGAGTSIDENRVFDPCATSTKSSGSGARGKDGDADETETVPASQLVPWVRLPSSTTSPD